MLALHSENPPNTSLFWFPPINLSHTPERGARLVKKVYAVDPLIGPNCRGRLRIISFIEDAALIERILWQAPPRTPQAPPSFPAEITLDPDPVGAWSLDICESRQVGTKA